MDRNLLIEEPSSLVFGQESAKQALSRFSIAITQVLDHFPTGNVVIVAHGTVMALWIAGRIGGDPFVYWKKLGLPSFAVFSRPDLKYVEFVENVT
jgi:broad specificity phosphatase PhoE